jgi:hypothetical protein
MSSSVNMGYLRQTGTWRWARDRTLDPHLLPCASEDAEEDRRVRAGRHGRGDGRPRRILGHAVRGEGIGDGPHHSGGLQEETTVLGVPCVTIRENTSVP